RLFDAAVSQLDEFPGPIDAIVSYWDFPSSVLHVLLCEHYGLPGPSLESVVKCEHKYWSRLEQRESIDEYPLFRHRRSARATTDPARRHVLCDVAEAGEVVLVESGVLAPGRSRVRGRGASYPCGGRTYR